MADLNKTQENMNVLYNELRDCVVRMTTEAMIMATFQLELSPEEIRATVAKALIQGGLDFMGAAKQASGSADAAEVMEEVEKTVIRMLAEWQGGAKKKFARAAQEVAKFSAELEKAGFPKAEPRRPN